MLGGLTGDHPVHQDYQRHYKQECQSETDHNDMNRVEFGPIAFQITAFAQPGK